MKGFLAFVGSKKGLIFIGATVALLVASKRKARASVLTVTPETGGLRGDAQPTVLPTAEIGGDGQPAGWEESCSTKFEGDMVHSRCVNPQTGELTFESSEPLDEWNKNTAGFESVGVFSARSG